jgi:cytochrome P450
MEMTAEEKTSIADRYDLRAPDLFLDPHALMARMRAEDPVYFSRQLGSWVLTRYDDVSAAMRDPRLSVVEETKRINALPPAEQESLLPLRRTFEAWGGRNKVDDHARFTKLLKRFFTPQRVEGMRPRLQAILDALLDRGSAALSRGELCMVNDVAHPFAMGVVTNLIGIPEAPMEMLLRCSNHISGLLEMGELEQLRRCQAGMLELSGYLAPVVARHRARPHDDLINVFVEADAAGIPYSDDDIIAQCIMFIVVGYHTTANLLCNGLMLLFQHPEQREKLRRRYDLLPNAFDEMMRYHGAVASVRRLAMVDHDVRGKRIKAGDTLVLAMVAANRDPEVFPDPGRFDIEREGASKHLGFTIGPYSCMGQALARLEGAVFYRTMLERTPRLRPSDAAPDWMVFRPFGRELRTFRVTAD